MAATPRQKRAVIESLKNIERKIPLGKGKVLEKAGYGRVVQLQPKQVFESEGFLRELEKYIKDKDLAKYHKKLLTKKQTIAKNNNKTGKIELIKTNEIDTQAVKNALEMAYRLKGYYAPDKNINLNIDEIMLNIIERRKNAKRENNI